MSNLLGIVAVMVALPGAIAAVHLTVISFASLFYRDLPVGAGKPFQFLVLIPAHNEEPVIGDAIDAISATSRIGDIVVVVADRCTDGTAMVAYGRGVEVVERPHSAEPGKAAAIIDALNTMRDREWDAVVIVDADSIVEPGFFAALEDAYATGVSIVQPRSEHVRQPSVLARASDAAFALQGVSLPRGRDRLGISVRLRGSGMTMLREIALARVFSTKGISEDLFYSIDLLLEGHIARHVDRARIRSLSAPSVAEGSRQRVRWEIGRIAAARRYSRRLIAAATPSTVDVAIHLLTPPLAVSILLVVLGAVLAWIAGWAWLSWLLVAILFAVAVDVAIGLVESRSPWQTWTALLVAPLYVLWKAGLQILAILRLRQADRPWKPTGRQ